MNIMKEGLKLNFYIFLFLLFCYYSCNRTDKNEINSTELIDTSIVEIGSVPDTVKRIEPIFNKEIVIDTTVKIIRKETPYRGELKYKYQWEDRNGLNRVIISQTLNYREGIKIAEIFAYQYIKRSNSWIRYWQMNDFVEDFGCDLRIDIKNVLITDIDSNKVVETLILYTLDSRCDAIFVDTKLLLFVNAQKIAIRGVSSQYLMPPEDIFNKQFPEGGYFKYKNIDPGVFPEDTIFVKYASDFWDNFIENENEKYRKEEEEFQKKLKEEEERKKIKRAKKNKK